MLEGIETTELTMTEEWNDVVMIGGGSAGLSAALTLARARRRVTVVDSGEPRNAPAAAAHGLLGLEGISPLELLARGRAEVSSYGGSIVFGRVTAAAARPGGFTVEVEGHGPLLARILLVASGVTDLLPDLHGLRERWGRDVVHCPYCHGWEIRDRRIGMLATGPMSPLQALLFRQWSSDVVFFPSTTEVSAENLSKLQAAGIPVIDGEVVGLEVTDDALRGVRLADGRLVALDALACPTSVEARLIGLEGLDLGTKRDAMGRSLVADDSGRTSAPDVWAAGNVANPAIQISEAAANGARVAMTINTELVLA